MHYTGSCAIKENRDPLVLNIVLNTRTTFSCYLTYVLVLTVLNRNKASVKEARVVLQRFNYGFDLRHLSKDLSHGDSMKRYFCFDFCLIWVQG